MVERPPGPRCIVQDYLHADVGLLIAPGGVGKTTLQLYEAVHVALGRPMYGLEVKNSGPVLILTAEDSREMLVARLRAICAELGLSDLERKQIMDRVRIADVSGCGFRLTMIADDVVVTNGHVEAVISACKSLRPAMLVIDPAAGLGVGEARVNDAEQGMIEAGRRLRNELNCCVRFVHHSGKQNARDGATDQYAGRGGSAFADGSRMVHVLRAMSATEWREAVGADLLPGETGLAIHRPKMSYCPPQGPIFLARNGHSYRHVEPASTAEGGIEHVARDVLRTITGEVAAGRFPTGRSLAAADTGLSRARLRDALAWLESTGQIETRKCPTSSRGGARSYLCPTGAPSAHQSENMSNGQDCRADENPVFGAPRPIGKTGAAQQSAHPVSPVPFDEPEHPGTPTAQQNSKPGEQPVSTEKSDWPGSSVEPTP